MRDGELHAFLGGIRGGIEKRVSQLPTHKNFLDYYCRAEDVASSEQKAVA